MHQYPEEQGHRTTRVVSVVAGTCIALACGTNYAYGAWAPNLGERLHLTSTEVNVIGNFGNIGMYAIGIPTGILIDTKGPRWGVVLGLVLLACGYFPLHSAYERGVGSMGVAALSFFAFLVGVGSCSAFAATIKTCASNWPQHRGTATAFPLSGFGLSALLFTGIASLAFGDDTAALLLFLSIGTCSMVAAGMLFMRIVPENGPYQAVPTEEGGSSSVRSGSRKSSRSAHGRARSRSRAREQVGKSASGPRPSASRNHLMHRIADETATESSSLVSAPGDPNPSNKPESVHSSTHGSADITGLALLKSAKFYQLFIMLGLLCGVGLMTINNIGNNARALWHHFDVSKSHEFIQRRQLMHVSNLSFFSFVGRLCSGIGSDWLIHRGHSRFWTLVASALIFIVAQICGLVIEHPTTLFLLSGLTGLGYGALFGVYPSLVVDAFGPSGMGVNWGAMTLAPVFSGNLFNIGYGAILDRHSRYKGDGHGGGERVCDEGKACYANAYWITLLSSVVGVSWALWCIRHEHVKKIRQGRSREREHAG